MFSVIRTRLRLSPAMVIAGLALVFAMTGGAYAAKKYLITSTKQISPSVLKALQGKAGKPGVPGAAGAQGAQGPAGPAGPAGSAGSGGAKGETGPAGVKGEKGSTGATGAKGATGATGATGFTETLPSGKTETGAWVISTGGKPSLTPEAAVSFSIPLPGPIASGKAFAFDQEETELEQFGKNETTGNPCIVGEAGCKDTGCHGSPAKPAAPKGGLCVYTHFENRQNTNPPFFEVNSFEGESGAASVSGGWIVGPTILGGGSKEPGLLEAVGSYAVTAP